MTDPLSKLTANRVEQTIGRPGMVIVPAAAGISVLLEFARHCHADPTGQYLIDDSFVFEFYLDPADKRRALTKAERAALWTILKRTYRRLYGWSIEKRLDE